MNRTTPRAPASLPRALAFCFALLVPTAAAFAPGCQEYPNIRPMPLEEQLRTVANGDWRTEEEIPRNQYRNPVETLQFFGIEPGMHVVEISPASGWYASILAPFLCWTDGKLTAAHHDPDRADWARESRNKFEKRLAASPKVYDCVELSTFPPGENQKIAPDGSADMVLTFRNVHNWMWNDGEQEAFRDFYRALKPGGVLGVVEHRAGPPQKDDPDAKSGYVYEDYVIELARNAGFRLDAKSEINANPEDDKDHPEGVWTLPPSLELGDKNREKYLEIGESDRMTLRFVKPEQGSVSNPEVPKGR